MFRQGQRVTIHHSKFLDSGQALFGNGDGITNGSHTGEWTITDSTFSGGGGALFLYRALSGGQSWDHALHFTHNWVTDYIAFMTGTVPAQHHVVVDIDGVDSPLPMSVGDIAVAGTPRSVLRVTLNGTEIIHEH